MAYAEGPTVYARSVGFDGVPFGDVATVFSFPAGQDIRYVRLARKGATYAILAVNRFATLDANGAVLGTREVENVHYRGLLPTSTGWSVLRDPNYPYSSGQASPSLDLLDDTGALVRNVPFERPVPSGTDWDRLGLDDGSWVYFGVHPDENPRALTGRRFSEDGALLHAPGEIAPIRFLGDVLLSTGNGLLYFNNGQIPATSQRFDANATALGPKNVVGPGAQARRFIAAATTQGGGVVLSDGGIVTIAPDGTVEDRSATCKGCAGSVFGNGKSTVVVSAAKFGRLYQRADYYVDRYFVLPLKCETFR